ATVDRAIVQTHGDKRCVVESVQPGTGAGDPDLIGSRLPGGKVPAAADNQASLHRSTAHSGQLLPQVRHRTRLRRAGYGGVGGPPHRWHVASARTALWMHRRRNAGASTGATSAGRPL